MKSSLIKLLCLLAVLSLALPSWAAEQPTTAPAAKAKATQPAAKKAGKKKAGKKAAAAQNAATTATAAKAAAAPSTTAPAAKDLTVPAAKPAATKAGARKATAAKAGTAKGKTQGRKATATKARTKAPVDPKAATAVAWEPYPRPGSWMQRHAGFVARAKQGKCDVLLLGDSITDGWNNQKELWEKYWAPLNAVNFGIGGDRTENIVYRITNGELEGIKPKVVMLLIGTNNTSKGDSAENIARGISVIVQTIQARQPQAKILLLGVYPRGQKPSDEQTAKYRENITQVNELIKSLDNGSSVRYLYFGDKFLAQDGTLPKNLMPDALHLSAAGYQIWIDSVIPVVKQMMQ